MTAIQQMLMGLGSNKITTRYLPGGYPGTYIDVLNSTTGPSGTTGYFSYGTTMGEVYLGKDYMALWQATASGTSTSSDIQILLDHNSTNIFSYNVEPQDTGDNYSFGGFYGFAGDGSGGFNNLVQLGSESSSSVDFESVQMIIMQLETNDVYNTSLGANNTTSSTYQTKCSVTIPKTGFYLIVAAAAVNASSSSGSIPKLRLFNGSTAYHEITSGYRKDTTNYVPYCASTTLSLTQENTISLQY